MPPVGGEAGTSLPRERVTQALLMIHARWRGEKQGLDGSWLQS
jgi:hypothetical protein